MTNEEYLKLAKKELLWGTSFMDQFHNQLISLYSNKIFRYMSCL